MMSIGGYFELEIREGEHFHQGAIKLSTARQCFEYILKARRYTKVYIPYYTCDVIIEPLMKLNVKYEYYLSVTTYPVSSLVIGLLHSG